MDEKKKDDKVKVPLAFAASSLATVAEAIESEDDVDLKLIQIFNDSSIDLADAVDRRIAFDGFIKSSIDHAYNVAEEWARKAKQLEAAYKRFKEQTISVIISNPNLPYKGKLGSLSIKKSNPKACYSLDDKNLDLETIEFLAIEPDYIVEETKYRIDKKKLIKDLKSGKEIPWATLKQSYQLVIKKS